MGASEASQLSLLENAVPKLVTVDRKTTTQFIVSDIRTQHRHLWLSLFEWIVVHLSKSAGQRGQPSCEFIFKGHAFNLHQVGPP